MRLVFEGEDLKISRRVAIKLLPSKLAAEPGVFQRFEREPRKGILHREIKPTTACQESPPFEKTPISGVPVLKQAKAEYARLQ